MWIPKWVRDAKSGVDSPMPTQVVSNEEFIPRPQSKRQKQVEHLINTMGEDNARRLGMTRREYMASSMGLALCFLASNKVFGNVWEVDEDETVEIGAYEDKWPKSEYFIIDVQSHFTNGFALGFRTMEMFKNQEFVKNMGFDLKNDQAAYAFPNFVKEMYFDSESAMLVISGVPGRERQVDRRGNELTGPPSVELGKKRGGGVLPSWLMSMRKKDINDMAGGTPRALCQGNCAPNHYWDESSNSQDTAALFEQMQREVEVYGIDSWKWYCHTDPGRSGDGFQLDDETLSYPFYEKSKELGLNVFSVHKGFSMQSRTLGHLANPADVEKAARDHPELTFIIYHSAMQHGPFEKEFAEKYDPETGDFAWHDVLMKIKERNPAMDNVYCEIGSTFGVLAVDEPDACQHLMGKNIKNYGADHVIWGTDCLWWGSPQWVIDAFKRFQIKDEFCDKFGYEKLTKDDKAKIFGLNAAKVYNVDVDAQRENIAKDGLSKLAAAYRESGGQRENAAYGWVRDDTSAKV